MAAETSIHHPKEYYTNLVHTLPKVPADYQIPDVQQPIPQFGGNFYWIFEGMHFRSTDPKGAAGEPMVQAYIGAVEKKFPDIWAQFCISHADLMQNIQTALKPVHMYFKIFDYLHDIRKEDIRNNTHNFESERHRLETDVHHPLGFTAIGISVWNGLNPFLEQAAKEMEAAGIPPSQFYA